VPSKSSGKIPSLPSKEKKPPPLVPTHSKDKKPAPTIPSKKDKKADAASAATASASDTAAAAAAGASAVGASLLASDAHAGATAGTGASHSGGAADHDFDGSTESDESEKKSSKAKESKGTKTPAAAAAAAAAGTASGTLKRNTNALSETEQLKVKLADAEDKLDKSRKEVHELTKQLKKAKLDAVSSDNEQATQLLSILARVNAAAAWSARVKALEPLLAQLAAVKQFEASAPGVVATKAHVESMQQFDGKCKAAAGDAKQQLGDAEQIVAKFSEVAKLNERDRVAQLKLIDAVAGALGDVARDAQVPAVTPPPHAISDVFTGFTSYKNHFEAVVVPSHAKIAKIIGELTATLDESAKMHLVVEDADSNFTELFANTKFYIDDRRARQQDPEFDALRAHYEAQLGALQGSIKQKEAASLSAKEHDRLTEEIKEARKKLRAKERELEDLREDGELVAGSPAEQKRVDEINALRAVVADLVRRDDEAARIAGGGAVAAAVPGAAAPLELTRRKLDSSYTYEPLAAGVLKGSLHGRDGKCVLKVTQVPPDAVLAQQLELLGRLKHANLAPVGAAFVDGPHLYVEVPFYERGNLEQWLTTLKPDAAAVQRVMFNVLSALAYMHDRGAAHGSVRPEAILVDAGDRAVLNSFWARPTGERNSDEYSAPELAGAASVKDATPSADMFSFGLLLLRAAGGVWPVRKAANELPALPKSKDKSLTALLGSLLEAEAGKRMPALKALNHAYFASQYANVDALLTANKGLRAVRAALLAIGQKQKLMSDAEVSDALAPLRAVDGAGALFASAQGLLLPVAGEDADALGKHEAIGKALLHATLKQQPTIARVAPSLLKHLLGTLPTSVRDLLRDMDAFDASRARHFRHVRLIDDVCQLGLKMADGSAVTNTNREAYLKEALGAELVDSRKSALERLRAGFFSIAGVKDEVRKLKPSELAVLIAGDEYLSGDMVLARTVVVPPTAAVDAFQQSVRALASDDLRRLLFAATGVAAITPTTTINVVATPGPKSGVQFLPLFSRIDLTVGSGSVEEALGEALTAIDAPLK
jgi:hypothetical protein